MHARQTRQLHKRQRAQHGNHKHRRQPGRHGVQQQPQLVVVTTAGAPELRGDEAARRVSNERAKRHSAATDKGTLQTRPSCRTEAAPPFAGLRGVNGRGLARA